MGKEHNRTQRIAREMQKEIAIILQHEMKNIQVSMVTVSSVKVSRGLAYTKVFITFLSDSPKEVESGVRTLQNASGFIRSLLGKSMRLRVMPELTFIYDNSLIEGIRMTNLVSQIMKKDRL